MGINYSDVKVPFDRLTYIIYLSWAIVQEIEGVEECRLARLKTTSSLLNSVRLKIPRPFKDGRKGAERETRSIPGAARLNLTRYRFRYSPHNWPGWLTGARQENGSNTSIKKVSLIGNQLVSAGIKRAAEEEARRSQPEDEDEREARRKRRRFEEGREERKRNREPGWKAEMKKKPMNVD